MRCIRMEVWIRHIPLFMEIIPIYVSGRQKCACGVSDTRYYAGKRNSVITIGVYSEQWHHVCMSATPSHSRNGFQKREREWRVGVEWLYYIIHYLHKLTALSLQTNIELKSKIIPPQWAHHHKRGICLDLHIIGGTQSTNATREKRKKPIYAVIRFQNYCFCHSQRK